MEFFGFLAIFFLLKFLYGVWKIGKEGREKLAAIELMIIQLLFCYNIAQKTIRKWNML